MLMTISINSIRLVVADVDGTLVGEDREISSRVRQAIGEAQRQGVRFALCTGRPLFTTRRYVEELHLPGFHIFDGGATIANPSTGELLYRYAYDPAVVRDVVAYVRREHLYLEVYSVDGYYVDTRGIHTKIHTAVMLSDPIIRDLDEVIGLMPVNKMEAIVIDDPERARMHAMAVHFADQLMMAWSRAPGTDADFVNVMPLGISKGTAVKHLIDHTGIPASQVMGIGDAGNDESLLHAVGLPIAMGSAPDSLKDVAHWVTAPVEADGLAVAIERYILSNGHDAPRP
jgi:Cof subfamily protein (haloacid dehalogenase superfamily)